jgi:hypothetical protein
MFRRLLDKLRRKPSAPTVPATTAPARPGAAPPKQGDVLTIAYEPRRDGDADPGEVVWTWIPYEDDPSQGKDRPALVIGFLGPDLAVLPLTSKDHTERPDCIELGTGPWDREGRTSYVKLDQLLRVAPGAVRREGASVDEARFDHVAQAFKRYVASGTDG